MGWAIVTGASRGIGRAIAVRLGGSGFDVVVGFRKESDAAHHVCQDIQSAGSQAEALRLDLGDSKQVQEAIQAWIDDQGPPEVLVNNAGITRDGLFAMMSEESWRDVLETNLVGLYGVTRPVVRSMLRQRRGCIVNVSSLAAQRGNAGQANYAASKAGLEGATKSLALELASRGIRVNAVAPGLIDTDMSEGVDHDAVLSHIPLGRLGRPEDVAGVVAFLCSEEASYITGQVLAINGGLYT